MTLAAAPGRSNPHHSAGGLLFDPALTCPVLGTRIDRCLGTAWTSLPFGANSRAFAIRCVSSQCNTGITVSACLPAPCAGALQPAYRPSGQDGARSRLLTQLRERRRSARDRVQRRFFRCGGRSRLRSRSNSASLLRYPDRTHGWSRPGIMLTALHPSRDKRSRVSGSLPERTLPTPSSRCKPDPVNNRRLCPRWLHIGGAAHAHRRRGAVTPIADPRPRTSGTRCCDWAAHAHGGPCRVHAVRHLTDLPGAGGRCAVCCWVKDAG